MIVQWSIHTRDLTDPAALRDALVLGWNDYVKARSPKDPPLPLGAEKEAAQAIEAAVVLASKFKSVHVTIRGQYPDPINPREWSGMLSVSLDWYE